MAQRTGIGALFVIIGWMGEFRRLRHQAHDRLLVGEEGEDESVLRVLSFD